VGFVTGVSCQITWHTSDSASRTLAAPNFSSSCLTYVSQSAWFRVSYRTILATAAYSGRS